jgi:hypothetical protein
LIACAGEVEDLGYTHVIAPTDVVRFGADGSLERIQDVAVAASGEIWALQRVRAPHLFVYSADGDLHDSFGATGNQRNELHNPYALMPTDDPQFPMAVWDAGNRRISTFNPYGRASVVEIYRSRGQVYAEIESHSYGKPLQMERLGNTYLLMDHANDLSVTSDYLRSELLRLGQRGELVDTLVDFAREFADSIAALSREVNYFAPIPLWGACPGGEMVLLEPFTRTLRWYDAEGSVVSREALTIPVRAVTEEDQEAFLRRRFELEWRRGQNTEPDSAVIQNSVDNFKLRHWDQFATTQPPAVGLMCAGGREVWLQEFSTRDNPLGLGSRWLVHGPETVGLVYVQFPEGFRPLRIVGRTVYGVAVAGEGLEVVAHVTVPDRIEAPAAAAEH